MDLEDGCTNDKYFHSGVELHEEYDCRNVAAGYHEKPKTQENELDGEGDKKGCKSSSSDTRKVAKDGMEDTYLRNLQQNEICEEFDGSYGKLSSDEISEESYGSNNKFSSCEICEAFDGRVSVHMEAKSSYGGYVVLPRNSTHRPKLKELLQLLADEEKANLEKSRLAVNPKQYKWWGVLDSDYKGLSLSSIFKPRDGENLDNKKQRKSSKIEGIFGKVAKLCKKQNAEWEKQVEHNIAEAYKKSNLKARLDSERKKRSKVIMEKPYWTKLACCSSLCVITRRSKNGKPKDILEVLEVTAG